MNKNPATDANHQTAGENSSQNGDTALINQANSIIAEWQDCAEKILKKYEESLSLIHTEQGTLPVKTAADDFTYLAYPSIQKKLKLPGDLSFIDEGARVTVAIQFQNKPRNVLRLYLCVIGKVQTPQWLYAELQYQFGRPIAVLQEDLNGELTTVNTRFKDWFSQIMETMFKSWLDT